MTDHVNISDLDIANAASMQPIEQVAAKLGIEPDDLEHYGKHKAKISMGLCQQVADKPMGRLVLVTSITPTPAGEGKTTTTIGLSDALNQIGKQSTVCIREPSMGPCFGMKGGAAGGGHSQVVPMEQINLHFTGDFHAIAMAHNLLAAAIDNHIHHGNLLGIDPRRISWRRVIDMNDRALRQVTIGLGGVTNSIPRESGFDITVASEVMAIFCLAESLTELRDRLGRIVVAQTYDRQPITAAEIKVHGAMTVLVKDAFKPNLVQTLENNPAIVHGGPFANIAHGCNSIMATKLSMRLSDYTVTEAGFGADLGAEKFFNIKCRKAGLRPDVAVVVVTVRALKLHGGAAPNDLGLPDAEAVAAGMANLEKHLENLDRFQVPAIVAVNIFDSDSKDELKTISKCCARLDVSAIQCDHWSRGGQGAQELAAAVVDQAENQDREFAVLYDDQMPLWQKVKTIAQEIYGADEIQGDQKLRNRFAALQEGGYGHLPICMAKTQYSLSTDPSLKGRPRHFAVPLRDVRLAAGAGFVVVLCGDIMTMPGLPKRPSAEAIDIDKESKIVGLF